jgi:rfaE bifunctional protein kinase chain/domain
MKMRRPDLSQAHVLVVGDVMLDRYWFGEVSRISPEAPVPVARITRTEERPGGAANVARNVAALGGRADLLAVVGNDEPGEALARLLKADGVQAQLTRDPTVNTTVKLRVIGRQQQLLRIDFENVPAPEALDAKRAEFDARLSAAKVVIFSDYGKGGLAHVDQMILQARAAGKIVLVDPKGDDFERYRGATVLTPNLGEFRQVAGRWSSEAELAQKAEKLRQSLGIDALLVTRSEEGMTLFSSTGALHVQEVA